MRVERHTHVAVIATHQTRRMSKLNWLRCGGVTRCTYSNLRCFGKYRCREKFHIILCSYLAKIGILETEQTRKREHRQQTQSYNTRNDKRCEDVMLLTSVFQLTNMRICSCSWFHVCLREHWLGGKYIPTFCAKHWRTETEHYPNVQEIKLRKTKSVRSFLGQRILDLLINAAFHLSFCAAISCSLGIGSETFPASNSTWPHFSITVEM